MKETISWADFEKIDMRVGTIIDAQIFEGAKKPAYQIQIDFGGEIGIKKSSAQLTVLYQASELIGKQIVAVVNFPKKQIGNFMSECLVLGAVDGNGAVHLLTTDIECANGLSIA
jgi:tRNA-binding protein